MVEAVTKNLSFFFLSDINQLLKIERQLESIFSEDTFEDISQELEE